MRSCNKTPKCWLLLASLLMLCCYLVGLQLASCATATSQVGEQQQQQSSTGGQVRAHFKLPKLFDFERFKVLYERHYRSSLEELIRAKIFLAKAFRAFISAVGFKYRKTTYWLGINGRSDRTRAELEALELTPDQVDMMMGGEGDGAAREDESAASRDGVTQTKEAKSRQQGEGEPKDQLVDLEDIDHELERIREHASEPGFKQIANELEHLRQTTVIISDQQSGDEGEEERPLSRSKRSVGSRGGASRKIRDFSIENSVFKDPDVDEGVDLSASERLRLVRLREGRRVASNNAQYLAPELESEQSATGGAGDKRVYEGPDYEAVRFALLFPEYWEMSKSFSRLPVKGNYKKMSASSEGFLGWRILGSITNTLVQGLNDMFGSDDGTAAIDAATKKVDATQATHSPTIQDDEGEGEDIVWVDHSAQGCMVPVRDQGSCGSCYAFATLAFLEWAHCNTTGKLVEFSTQYMVDCGKKFQAKVNGCSGAHVSASIEFVHNFGLELERNYPYRAKEGECPYDYDTPATSMGFLRVNLKDVGLVPIRSFEHHLKFTPLVVTVGTRGDFHDYAGGVHDGKNCGERGTHAMLLVGHGREDGEEYWLIRNSYSSHYGEKGYYKLNKNSDCILPRRGFILGTKNGEKVDIFPRENANRTALKTKKTSFLG